MAKTTATELFIGNAKKSFTHFCSRFIRVLLLDFQQFPFIINNAAAP